MVCHDKKEKSIEDSRTAAVFAFGRAKVGNKTKISEPFNE